MKHIAAAYHAVEGHAMNALPKMPARHITPGFVVKSPPRIDLLRLRFAPRFGRSAQLNYRPDVRKQAIESASADELIQSSMSSSAAERQSRHFASNANHPYGVIRLAEARKHLIEWLVIRLSSCRDEHAYDFIYKS